MAEKYINPHTDFGFKRLFGSEFCSPRRGGNPRSIFYELQVYVLRIASLCFIHEMPVVLVIVYGFVLANIPNNKNTGNTDG